MLSLRLGLGDSRCDLVKRREALPLLGVAAAAVDIVEKFLLRLDRAQWRHTIRIVHRHCRAFQRGRRGATV